MSSLHELPDQCPSHTLTILSSHPDVVTNFIGIVTADRKPDQLPTTVDGAPVATVAPGLLPIATNDEIEEGRSGEGDVAEGESMEVDQQAR